MQAGAWDKPQFHAQSHGRRNPFRPFRAAASPPPGARKWPAPCSPPPSPPGRRPGLGRRGLCAVDLAIPFSSYSPNLFDIYKQTFYIYNTGQMVLWTGLTGAHSPSEAWEQVEWAKTHRLFELRRRAAIRIIGGSVGAVSMAIATNSTSLMNALTGTPMDRAAPPCASRTMTVSNVVPELRRDLGRVVAVRALAGGAGDRTRRPGRLHARSVPALLCIAVSGAIKRGRDQRARCSTLFGLDGLAPAPR